MPLFILDNDCARAIKSLKIKTMATEGVKD